MAKIIRTEAASRVSIEKYERNVLEAIGPEHSRGGDYVDPAAILAEARAEAERKVQEAYAEGLRRGSEMGEQEFQEAVGEAAAMLRQSGAALEAARRAFLDSLEPQVVKLAESIARRILHREAQISSDVVQRAARDALEFLADQEQVTLRVNPADLDVIRDKRIDVLGDFDGIRKLDVVPDESVEPGGCVAESNRLRADAQLSAQLDKIMEQIET